MPFDFSEPGKIKVNVPIETITLKPATFEFDGHKFLGVRLDSSLAGIYYLAKRGRQGDENALQVLVACQIVLKTVDGIDYFNWRTVRFFNWNAAMARMGEKMEDVITGEDYYHCTRLALRYSDGERSEELYNAIVAAGQGEL